jgi:hypothetical protein
MALTRIHLLTMRNKPHKFILRPARADGVDLAQFTLAYAQLSALILFEFVVPRSA